MMPFDRMSRLEELAVLKGHTDRVWHVSWDPTGSFLATCGGDRAIRIWGSTPVRGAEDGSKEWRLLATLDDAQTRTVRSCEWSPCGKLLAAVSFDASCVIWALSRKGAAMDWEVLASLEGHENEVKSVAWNRGGTLLATCSRDKSVWIWETLQDHDFECLSVLHGHEQDVKFVKFHPREDVLFSASYDDTVKVWEEGDGDWVCVDTLSGHTSTVWGLANGPGDDAVVSCSDDSTLIIWKRTEPKKWRNVCRLSGYHTGTIYSVDWSRSTGAIVSGAADDSIRVFVEREGSGGWASDAPSYVSDVYKPKAHDADVNCVRWNPGRPDLLASAGDDQLVKIWKYVKYGDGGDMDGHTDVN